MATDAPFGPTEANAKASVPQVPAPPVIGLPYMSTSELALLRQLVAGLQAYSEFGIGGSTRVASVNVVENVGGLEAATAQAALGGSCRVSWVSGGLSISPMASTPM